MTVLVDSSVWINHLRARETAAVRWLSAALETQRDAVVVADLVLLEVVRGCRTDGQARRVAALLQQFPVVEVGGVTGGLHAANLYRRLRTAGSTLDKTVDLLLGAWCIRERAALLHDDADFDLLQRYGLRCIEP